MGQTELIVLASLGTCSALVFAIFCCVRGCLRRQLNLGVAETFQVLSAQRHNTPLDRQQLISNKQEAKILVTPQDKEITDYRQLNKQFQNDQIDKNAMVISVFNLENESALHRKRKLTSLKRFSPSQTQTPQTHLFNIDSTLQHTNT